MLGLTQALPDGIKGIDVNAFSQARLATHQALEFGMQCAGQRV